MIRAASIDSAAVAANGLPPEVADMEISHVENIVLTALRLAARQFEHDAAVAEFPKRLREQFIAQAQEALRVAELIEVGVFVLIEQRSALDGDAATPPLQSSTKMPTVPDSSSAKSSSPLIGEHVNGAPRRVTTPAVAGNDGGILFADVILDAMAVYNARPNRYYECHNGFAHPVGQPCNNQCGPVRTRSGLQFRVFPLA